MKHVNDGECPHSTLSVTLLCRLTFVTQLELVERICLHQFITIYQHTSLELSLKLMSFSMKKLRGRMLHSAGKQRHSIGRPERIDE